MDTAEHLVRHDNAMRPALGDSLEHAAAWAVDARQAIDPGAAREPRRIGLGTGGAPACADGRALVHPRPSRVAVDPGGREIRQRPAFKGTAVTGQHRIEALSARRHRGEDMVRVRQRDAHIALVLEGQRAVPPGRDDLPALRFQSAGDDRGGVAEAEDEHAGHGRGLTVRGGIRHPKA